MRAKLSLRSYHASQVTHVALLDAGIGALIPSGTCSSLNILGLSGTAHFLLYKSAFLSLSILVLGLDRCFKLSNFTPGGPLFYSTVNIVRSLHNFLYMSGAQVRAQHETYEHTT